MALETGNKLNNLLSEGTPNGLYFSEWLGAHGYSSQLLQQYRNSDWLKLLTRGVYYRSGEELSAYAALMNPGSANMTMDQGSTINPEQW